MIIKRMLVALLLSFAATLSYAEPDYWIDVRTAEEYASAHAAAAINIPHDQIAQKIAAVTQNKEAEIWLYCRSGRRSGIALETLEGMGYTQVKNIGGLEDALKRQAALENAP